MPPLGYSTGGAYAENAAPGQMTTGCGRSDLQTAPPETFEEAMNHAGEHQGAPREGDGLDICGDGRDDRAGGGGQ
jgi:hypothetical protein